MFICLYNDIYIHIYIYVYNYIRATLYTYTSVYVTKHAPRIRYGKQARFDLRPAGRPRVEAGRASAGSSSRPRWANSPQRKPPGSMAFSPHGWKIVLKIPWENPLVSYMKFNPGMT